MAIMSESKPGIDELYATHFAGSYARSVVARKLFPAGVTHDNRYLDPFPIYVERALGSKKYDVDGHELIDYWVGHGSLLLGHGREEVIAAVVEQVHKGTHYGACHDIELQWAKLITELVPCAQEVKFTSSGTEATLLAFRLARAFTGRKKILKFTGHFHGWHDYATLGVTPPYDVPTSAGIPDEIKATMVVVPANDMEGTRSALERGDVAAVILEPSGGFHGLVPLKPGFLTELRDATRATDTLLIFDEVITGFRWSPGGVQALSGVTPDLSTQAKVLAGGFPGGAVVGRADVLNLFNFPADPEARRFKRIAHPGTFNANPVSAAAGVATLHLVKSGEPTRRANEMATLLRAGLADVFRRLGVPGLVYGDASVFWLLFGPALPANVQDTSVLWQLGSATLQRGLGDLGGAFRRAMLLEGVDLMGATGMLSAAHDTCDVERTIDGFERALIRLRDDGALAS